MATDFELLDAWRTGDRGAGNTLFERYFDPVCRFFSNKVHHNIDDLIQRTFLGCVEGRDRFQKQASFRTYLFAVAHNVLRAYFRERRRGDEQDAPGGLDDDSRDEDSPSPSSVVANHQEQRLLLEALRRIPLDYQLVLELYYWEGLNSREIADMDDSPESTIRTRLRRAKERLEKRLEELADSPLLARETASNLDGWARHLRDQLDKP